jgi:hypothetical protein
MGATGALTWEPGQMKISLTDPKADQYGLDQVSTEIYYQRSDEKPGSGFQPNDERPNRGALMAGTDLDIVIEWKDLELKDSVYVQFSLMSYLRTSKRNKGVAEVQKASIGLMLFHNRAILMMPFTENKVVKLASLPKSGSVVFKRRHSDPKTSQNIAGTIELNTGGIRESLTYHDAGMFDLPFIGLHFRKDALGTSSITITKCDFNEIKAPYDPEQDAASYSDDFACNSTTKEDY